MAYRGGVFRSRWVPPAQPQDKSIATFTIKAEVVVGKAYTQALVVF